MSILLILMSMNFKGLTRSSRNNVADFIIAVVGSRATNNADGLIPDEYCLTPSGYHCFVFDTTKLTG